MLRKIILLLFILFVLLLAVSIAPWLQPLQTVAIDRIDPALLAAVPEDATEIYVVPYFASFWRAATTNGVAKVIMAEQRKELWVAPFMLGNSPVLYWRNDDDESGIVTRLAPARHFVARTYLERITGSDVHAEGEILSNAPIGRSSFELSPSLVSAVGEGHAFIIYPTARPTFPPLGRPMLARLNFESNGAVIRGVGRSEGSASPQAPRLSLPDHAALAASLGAAPEWVGDLDRILGIDVSAALKKGFGVALYDVEAKSLTIQPKLVLVLPGEGDAVLRSFRGLSRAASVLLGSSSAVKKRTVEGVEITRTDDGIVSIESASFEGHTLVALDETSIPRFLEEERSVIGGTGSWTLRAHPERLSPILEKLREHRVLRLVARKLQRNVSSLHRTMKSFEGARLVEMTLRPGPEVDALDVTITPK